MITTDDLARCLKALETDNIFRRHTVCVFFPIKQWNQTSVAPTSLAACALLLLPACFHYTKINTGSPGSRHSPLQYSERERERVVVTWRAPGVGPWASTFPSPEATSRHCGIQTTKYVIPRHTKETWAWESNCMPMLVVSCSNLQIQRSLNVTTFKKLCQLAVASNVTTW